MKLYEVDDAIERLFIEEIDPETGELTETVEEKLDGLELEREQLILSLAGYYKGELAEAKAVKEEATKLSARAAQHQRRADRIKDYIAKHSPAGMEWRNANSRVFRRRSPGKAVLENEEWARDKDELMKNVDLAFVEIVETVKLDRAGALRALKDGETVRGFRLERGTILKIE